MDKCKGHRGSNPSSCHKLEAKENQAFLCVKVGCI